MMRKKLLSLAAVGVLAVSGATAASASAVSTYTSSASSVTGSLNANAVVFTVGGAALMVKCTASSGTITGLSTTGASLPASFSFGSNPTFSTCTPYIAGASAGYTVAIETTAGNTDNCTSPASTVGTWGASLKATALDGSFDLPTHAACVIVTKTSTGEKCLVEVGPNSGTYGVATTGYPTGGSAMAPYSATNLYVNDTNIPVAVRKTGTGILSCPTSSTTASFYADDASHGSPSTATGHYNLGGATISES